MNIKKIKLSRNGQEWNLEIPRGQRKTERGGNVLLQSHLWCPNAERGFVHLKLSPGILGCVFFPGISQSDSLLRDRVRP